MTAKPALVAISCFALGMVLQALLMLGGRFRRGDWGRAAGALAAWLLGLIPGKHELEYHLLLHVFYGLLVVAFVFTYLFRDRLLTHIGGRVLLAWNLLLVYVAVNGGWDSPLELLLLLLPTVPTVVNAFTDIDRNFGWKVFFQAWFSTILVVIAINGFDAGLFGVFEPDGGVRPALRSPFEMIAGGAAFLYIIANAWFVLALVPIPLARGQSPRAHGPAGPRLRLGARRPAAQPRRACRPAGRACCDQLRRRERARRGPVRDRDDAAGRRAGRAGAAGAERREQAGAGEATPRMSYRGSKWV